MANVVWTPDTEEAGGYVQIVDAKTGATIDCVNSPAICDAIAAGSVADADIAKAGAYALGMWARYDWYYGSVAEYRKTGQSEAASADTGTLVQVLEARARSIQDLAPKNADLKAALDKICQACALFREAGFDSNTITEGLATIAKRF